MIAATRRERAMPCAMTFCLEGLDRRPHAAGRTRRIAGVAARGRARRGERPLLRGTRPRPCRIARLRIAAGGFPLADSPGLLALRDLNRALPAWIALAVGLAFLARGSQAPDEPHGCPGPSAILVVLGTYALAPLGVVHLLKNTFGRAPAPTTSSPSARPHVHGRLAGLAGLRAQLLLLLGRGRIAAVLPVLVLLCPAGGGWRRSSSSCPSRSPPR